MPQVADGDGQAGAAPDAEGEAPMNITAYGVTVTVRDERELLAALAYLEAVRQLRLPLAIERAATVGV